MGDWTKKFDPLLFRQPLIACDEELEQAVLAAGRDKLDGALNDLIAERKRVDAFEAKLRAVHAAANPVSQLAALPGKLAQQFPDILVAQSGIWSAYYFINSEAKLLYGLLVLRGPVSAQELAKRLDDARKRALARLAKGRS